MSDQNLAGGAPVGWRKRLFSTTARSSPLRRSGPRPVVAVVGVLAVLAAGATTTIGTRTTSASVVLEAADVVGRQPFVALLTSPVPELAPTVGLAVVTGAADDSTRSALVVRGDQVGLYGGTTDDARCDRDALLAFLESSPSHAAAWASVQGIDEGELGSFLEALTPVVLRYDTRVTNHGFEDGQATPRQSVLQAGTSVLVDRQGVPRARCACGNPLVPPAPVETQTFEGRAWDGFDAEQVVAVTPGRPVDALVLTSLESGDLVERPVGTAVVQDRPHRSPTGPDAGSAAGERDDDPSSVGSGPGLDARMGAVVGGGPTGPGTPGVADPVPGASPIQAPAPGLTVDPETALRVERAARAAASAAAAPAPGGAAPATPGRRVAEVAGNDLSRGAIQVNPGVTRGPAAIGVDPRAAATTPDRGNGVVGGSGPRAVETAPNVAAPVTNDTPAINSGTGPVTGGGRAGGGVQAGVGPVAETPSNAVKNEAQTATSPGTEGVAGAGSAANPGRGSVTATGDRAAVVAGEAARIQAGTAVTEGLGRVNAGRPTVQFDAGSLQAGAPQVAVPQLEGALSQRGG